MRSILSLVLCGALLSPHIANADIFRWVDDRGVVSFTDNLGNIPAKFRTKAVQVDAPVEAVQEVVVEAKQPAATKDKDKADKAEAADDPKKKKLYGGKDEATWKKEAERLNFQVTDTEKQIAELRDRMGDTSKMSRTEYLSLQNSQKLLEKRLETQKREQETFMDAARKAGAPL